MTTSTTTPGAWNRFVRALASYSAHTAETYRTAYGAGSQRPSAHRTAEDIALHA